VESRDGSEEKEPQRIASEATETPKAIAVATLVGNITHDLNNLLMGIQGNISLLSLDKPPGHKDTSYLRNIERAVEQASDLTRQIVETVCGVKEPALVPGSSLPDISNRLVQKRGDVEDAKPTVKGILLVEDEEIVASIGEKMLTRLGYRVWVASSGIEAIERYRQCRSEIDLVILDIVMPGMVGGDVLEHLRSINPQVAVLLSSGYGLNDQTMEIMKRGCRGFIQKPFSIEQLKQKIRQTLEG
jgi:CheY-like chemotaxis protein